MSSKSNSPPKDKEKPPANKSGSSSSSSSSPRRSSRSHSKDKAQRGRPVRKESSLPAPNAKLFVTNIDSKFQQSELDKDLRDWFAPFGKIKDIVIKTKSGSANCYCFVEYEDVQSATKAVEELNHKQFKGKELKVEFGKGQRKNQDRKSDKCYICHKEGHFAKDCRYNRFNDRDYDKYRRDDRDRRDHYYDRDYDRDRRYRDRRDYRDRKHRRSSYSSSSSQSSRNLRRRERDRDDYRRPRDRDSRRSPDRTDRKRNYHSDSRRYD